MNIRAKLTIVSTLLSIIAVVGCDGQEFLNNATPPSDEGPGQGKWQSVEDLDLLAAGTYWMTSGECCNESQQVVGSWARTMPTDIAVPLADGGEGFFLDQKDADVFYGRNPNNPDNTSLEDIWQSTYAAIANSNSGIEFIENKFFDDDGQVPFEDPNNWIPRIYGELKFLRAYNYYILAKTFSPPYSQNNLAEKGVIMRTEPTNSFNAASKPLGTVEELYNLLITDLQQAIDNLPNEPKPNDPEFYNYSRATKPAATTLLARINFEMQNWGAAQDLATEVINDPRFTLTEEPIVAWNQDTFNRPNEVIWYYQWVDGDGVGHNSDWKWPKGWNSWNATRANWGNVGSIINNVKFVSVSYSFLENVGWIDNINDLNETSSATQDLRYQQLYKRFEANDAAGGLAFNKPTVWINKYYRSENYPPTTNVPLLRVSEMYLTRSIISFLGGNGATKNLEQARNDINKIRQRAGLQSINQGQLTAEIIHAERMKELAFEGDRLPYLQALRIDIPNGDRGSGSIPWNDPNLVFTIPNSETDFNNAVQ